MFEVGNTPLVELPKIREEKNLNAKIFAKLESFNPAGSAKDRVAEKMIARAEKAGLLKKGAVIIEPTSGNTGIGLCAIAAAKGYKAIIVMPDTMSVERINLMHAYGAQVVLTPGEKCMSMERQQQYLADMFQPTNIIFISLQLKLGITIRRKPVMQLILILLQEETSGFLSMPV